MIPWSDIKKIFADTSPILAAVKAVYPTFKLIRANQPGDAPAYPFGTYMIMSDGNESPHQNVKENAVDGDDETLINVTRYEKTKIRISLNFIDKNAVEKAYAIAEIFFRWFISTSGKEFCMTNNLVPILINPQIQDRTILTDDLTWETRWGFDVRFDTSTTTTEQIETVDEISITSEVDGENEETYIVEMTDE
jgi:hypothetical protein